jgi:hypothetical protein
VCGKTKECYDLPHDLALTPKENKDGSECQQEG